MCPKGASLAPSRTWDHAACTERRIPSCATSGEASRRALESADCRVDWHTYLIVHSVCIEEIVALRAWISKVLAG